jgi:hypothetical protein
MLGHHAHSARQRPRTHTTHPHAKKKKLTPTAGTHHAVRLHTPHRPTCATQVERNTAARMRTACARGPMDARPPFAERSPKNPRTRRAPAAPVVVDRQTAVLVRGHGGRGGGAALPQRSLCALPASPSKAANAPTGGGDLLGDAARPLPVGDGWLKGGVCLSLGTA